jgi:hypothetical protein
MSVLMIVCRRRTGPRWFFRSPVVRREEEPKGVRPGHGAHQPKEVARSVTLPARIVVGLVATQCRVLFPLKDLR